jgi:RNA polymerase sigma-70 factor (ECF subfamily)
MKELDSITLHRAIKGDRKAFKALYDHYSPFVWRLVFKMVSGDQFLAQELLQETFVKLHGSIGNFRGEAGLSTWIYRIAYNLSITAFNQRKRFTSLDSTENLLAGKEQADYYDNSEFIKKVLAALSADDRFLLVAREVDGMGYDEISEITGQNEGALRTRLHRIKEQLHIQSEKLLTGRSVHA